LPQVWAHTRSSLRNSLSPQCGWVHTRPRTRPQLSVLVRHTAAPVIPSARNAAGFIRGPVPVLSSAYWLGIQLPHGYAGFAPFSHLPSRLSSSLRILPSPSPIARRLARRLSRLADRPYRSFDRSSSMRVRDRWFHGFPGGWFTAPRRRLARRTARMGMVVDLMS
jgi:hypothetical protein